jgi:spore germination cell wall hydrolase CwlJ-like protein
MMNARMRFYTAIILIPLMAAQAGANTPTDAAMEIARLIPAAPYTGREVDMLAKMVWGEALGCTAEEQALCVWTAINRLEDGRFGDTLADVLIAPGQFTGYSHKNPVVAEMREVVKKCLTAWMRNEPAPLLPPYARPRICTSTGAVGITGLEGRGDDE